MIDLTPLDVRKKKRDFTKALRGYEPKEVDHFLDTVAERLEEVVKMNLSLRERVEILTERLSGQEGRERAVQEALITAQSLKQNIEEQTKRDSEVILREAETAAESLRSEAESYADALKREAESYADMVKREADVNAEVIRREAESRAAEARRDIEVASEGVRENVKRLLQERRRELVELNRGRARFLKAFRNLLERELDVVEVAESNIPSEELDLDLLKFGRGATRTETAVVEAASGAVEAVVAGLVKAELARGVEVAPATTDGAAADVAPALAADLAPDEADDLAPARGDGHSPGMADDRVIGAIPAQDREPLPDPLPGEDANSVPAEERWGVR
jgi:DivIVA domain-containing protein